MDFDGTFSNLVVLTTWSGLFELTSLNPSPLFELANCEFVLPPSMADDEKVDVSENDFRVFE